MEIRGLLPPPTQPVQKRVNSVIFEFDFAYGKMIREMYLGMYEMRIVKAMREILRPGDIFIDAGANIGYLSAVGAGLVGKTGEIHCFEPVPEYFQRLQKLATMNPDYKIIANQCAVGDADETAWIDMINPAVHPDIGLSTMVPGFMKENERLKRIQVPVCRLDSYIKGHNLKNITLIKIDVEGFEFPALKGLQDFLEHTDKRPAIICEIRPEICSLMGYQLKDLFDYMKSFGYITFDLNKKQVDWPEVKELTNFLFIPAAKMSP